MVEISKANVKKENLEAFVAIKQQDIFDLDLGNVSVVALYLFPELNVAPIPQLEKMKPCSRIVAHDYGIDGVDPDVTAIVHRKDSKSNKIFLYTTPLKQPPTHVFQKLFGKDKKTNKDQQRSWSFRNIRLCYFLGDENFRAATQPLFKNCSK